MVAKGEYNRRLDRFREVMAKYGVDCVVLNGSRSIQYLTGVNNVCTWLFIKRTGGLTALVLESDYLEYKKQTAIVEDIRVHRPHDPLALFKHLAAELDLADGSLAAEKEHLNHTYFQMLEAYFGAKLRQDISADDLMQEPRMVKLPDEIEKIRKASGLAMLGMRVIGENVVKGATEVALARCAGEAMAREGAGASTYTYIGTDGRSSLAHHAATGNQVVDGPIAIDIHCCYQGYYADMARTLFLPGHPPEQEEMYEYLKGSIRAAIDAIKPGMTLMQVRKLFYQGFRPKGDWFALSGPLIHGVGIYNYEAPSFTYPHQERGWPPDVLIAENMVLALSNIGLCSRKGWGVRFEDTFLVTEGSPAILTYAE